MKRYGEISDVIYRNHGYDHYNMAIKYKLSYEGEVYFVFVNTMKELKQEINKLIGNQYEQS